VRRLSVRIVQLSGKAIIKAPSTPATMSKQHSTLLPQTATMSYDSIVKFRPFDNVECCFDIVAGVDGA